MKKNKSACYTTLMQKKTKKKVRRNLETPHLDRKISDPIKTKSIIYVDSSIHALSSKKGCAFFLVLVRRLERVHVGSLIRHYCCYSLCVGCYGLCLGCHIHYEGCFRHRVCCCILYVGCIAAIWAVTTFMCAIANSIWAVYALCVILQHLCELLQAL